VLSISVLTSIFLLLFNNEGRERALRARAEVEPNLKAWKLDI